MAAERIASNPGPACKTLIQANQVTSLHYKILPARSGNAAESDQVKGRRVGVGIDYGTSNSAAALFDGQNVRMVRLESQSLVMPSATYIDRDYHIVTGQEAIDSYIQSNTGRKVELSAEVLGEGRTSTGEIGDRGLPEEASTETIYGQSFVDGGQPGRLFRGIKRLLGSPDNQRMMVFDRPFRLVALITPLLLRIFRSVSALVGEQNHACIGHPVNFEGQGDSRNNKALALLSEAYGYAGFAQQSFYAEPIAAALSYLHDNPQQQAQTILAVDFGGGTLDLCLLRFDGSGYEVIATHGVGLGGDHVDQALFRHLLFPLLGKGERWRRAGEDREIETLFPFEQYEDLLLNWAVSYMLNQNQYTTPLKQRIEVGDQAAEKFQRLYDMIKNNYSYLVFQCLKDAKAELSSKESVCLDIPELDIEIDISRAQFEECIAPLLDTFDQAVARTLELAEFAQADVELVIRTGGSSLIPAVRRMLEARFPGKVVEHDPFTSVAAGLAIAEYYELGSTN